MSRLLLALPLTLALGAFAACSGSNDEPDGGVTGEPDAGQTGEVDAGTDAGTEDAGTMFPALGAPCAYGTVECGEGRLCSSLYGNGMGGVDETTATCFATCSQQGAACTAAGDRMGTCTAVSQPSGGKLACVVQAGNFEVCANSQNSVCAMGVNCLRLGGSELGVCGSVCDTSNPMCPGTMQCSTSPIAVTLGDGGTGGVCAEPSTVGDTCNPDPANGPVRVCTGTQQCASMGGGAATCQEP